MSVEVKLRGIEELQRAVLGLKDDLRKKVVMGALRDGAKPIVKAAKALAPVKSGLLRSRIKVSASKIYKGQGGVFGVYINVKAVKGRRVKGTKVIVNVKGGSPFYWKFLELGTRKMGKHAFLKPAAEQHFPESITIIQARLAERIAKADQNK